MVAANHIVPKIDSREFDLSQINNALNLVALGHTIGKVIVHFPEYQFETMRSEKSGRIVSP